MLALRRPSAPGTQQRIPPALTHVAHAGRGERGLRFGFAFGAVAGQWARRAQFCARTSAPFADVGDFARLAWHGTLAVVVTEL